MLLKLVDLRSRSVVPDYVSQSSLHDVLLLGGFEAAAVRGLVCEEKPVTILESLELAPEKTGKCRAHKLSRGNFLKETTWEYFQFIKISIESYDVRVCYTILPLKRISDTTHILSVLEVGC